MPGTEQESVEEMRRVWEKECLAVVDIELSSGFEPTSSHFMRKNNYLKNESGARTELESQLITT
jgi:hypothetical protein